MATLGTGSPDVPLFDAQPTRWQAAWGTIALLAVVGLALLVFVVLGPFMWLDGQLRKS